MADAGEEALDLARIERLASLGLDSLLPHHAHLESTRTPRSQPHSDQVFDVVSSAVPDMAHCKLS